MVYYSRSSKTMVLDNIFWGTLFNSLADSNFYNSIFHLCDAKINFFFDIAYNKRHYFQIKIKILIWGVEK